MIGMSFIEFGVFFLLLGNQGTVGVPLGIPPAEEVQLMSDVAPEKCLFYASWATAGPLNPEGNPTERWFAQPKIQAAWGRLQNWLLVESVPMEQWEEDYQKPMAQLLQLLTKQALMRASAVFVEDGETLKDLSGGAIIHLEADAATEFATHIAALRDSLPESWQPREFTVEDNQYLAVKIDDPEMEVAIGLRGQFAIIGFGRDAIANIEKKVRTPEPAWLTDLKSRLVVERRASISHIDIAGWYRVLSQEDMDEVGRSVLNALKLETLGAFQSVCGLDEHGFIARHSLEIHGEKLEGLASLLDVEPLTDGHLQSLSKDRDWISAVRLSIPNGFALVETLASVDGDTLDEPLQEFERSFGVKLKEDFLDQLDGTILIQGNLDGGNPFGGWLIQLGIDDEMTFYDNLQTFHDGLQALLETEGGYSKLVAEEVEGIETHRVETTTEMAMMAAFIPEPIWFLRGGKLCIALEKETAAQWIKSPGDLLPSDPHYQRLAADAQKFGLPNPIGLTRIEMADVFRLLMSFSSMLDMAGAPIRASDLPSVDVLVNGMEPSVSAIYRTPRGFEFIARQTLPSSAPGATVASAFMLGSPSILRVRAAAQRATSTNQMRQILLALLNYEATFERFPARFNQDADGKPLLSWRVHILPFIEGEDLYSEFHLDEPWDSEHNLKLVERMPPIYRHPKLELEPGHTVYVAPQGKDTTWISPTSDAKNPPGLRLTDMVDGTSNTATVLEASADSAVIWTKPDDFSVDGDDLTDRMKPIWPAGIMLGFADGSVRFFKPSLKAEDWQALFGYRDGKVVDLEMWEGGNR